MSEPPERSALGRSAGTLSAGVGIAGALTYFFFSLASHNLDPVAYGEVVVLWSAVFVTISVAHRPVEQYLSRTVAEHLAHGEAIGPAMRTAARLQGAIAVGFAVVALALRSPIEDDLLSGNETLYWIYVASVLCFAASFFARGFLAGSGRFSILAGLLVSESASRAAFALLVALGITEGQDAIALGIVAAPIFSLVVVPLAFLRSSPTGAQAPPRTPAGITRATSSASPAGVRGGASANGITRATSSASPAGVRGGAFAGAVFLIMLAEQTFLNGGPLLLRGFEGAAAAGYIFNVLMLARAPLLVFQGVAISLLPHLTRLRSRSGDDARQEFEVSVTQTLRAIVAFTAVVAAIVAIAGPALMQVAFGDRFEYDRAGLLIVTVAMGLYLAATTLNQAALAQGQARRAAVAWTLTAIGFVVWCVVPVIADADLRIELGFAAAAAALFLALRRIYRDPAEGAGLSASDEIGARLALADEAG